MENILVVKGLKCINIYSEGLDNFWKVISEGRNCTVEIPIDRFDTKKWYDPDPSKPGKMWTTRAALIEGLNEFDNKLFRITSSEAENMDPQHKLLLECTYRALEDAGYPLESVNGSNTGVFIGLMNKDFEIIYTNDQYSTNHYYATGVAMSIASNRISYCFNLTGPSLTIDTACSSSLVALHYACQAIENGDCEMAVCGGVSCLLEPRVFVALTKAKMISPEGTSKPFSSKGDGYGRGEGCGIVLLKKLRKAKEDGSKVWGVICANEVNHDGRSVTPITKPSQSQQEALLSTVYSKVDPSALQYVEAHGTGTPVGDPVEAASIGNIIGKRRPSGSPPLKIGSVKGNIGHTESAAGMAGLIKVLLMMHHEAIPPSLHYSSEVGIANIEKSKLKVPVTNEKWKKDSKFGRAAGINSFGFGGTNVHMVVKQHKQNNSNLVSKRPVEIFVISAFSSKSLHLTIEDTRKQINKLGSLSLENLVYTSACRRTHVDYKYRKAFLASSLNHLQEQLASGNTETSPTQRNLHIVFVFCGNGVVYKGMGKMLLRSEPVFRKKCVEIDELLQKYTSLSVIQLLESEYDDFSRPDITQWLIFTIQIALVTLLRYWGIKPDSIVGHSVGEVAAAHCSGLLSLSDAVKVIYYRSTLQSKVTGGKMLVVGNVPVVEISKDITSYKGKINMAAYNSPVSCTVSGDTESVGRFYDQLNQQYSKRNIFLYKLDVPAAYHSHMMDPILEEIEEELQDLKAQTLNVDIISTVTGVKSSKGDFTTGKYWATNIREPVAFDQALRSSIEDKENPVFIEIGPRRALQRNIVEILGKDSVILPSAQPDKEGYNPDWCNVFEGYKSVPAPIPRYQFDHIKLDVNFEKVRQGTLPVETSRHPLVQKMSEDSAEYRCTISKALTPYVYEHKNNGTALVPGSFYAELGLASAMTGLKPVVPLSSLSISVDFSSPCVVNQESLNLTIKLEERNNETHFEILSSHVFATGRIEKISNTLEEKRINFQHILKRCNQILKPEEIYDSLSMLGFHYGDVYRQLSDIHYGGELKEGLARVTVSDEISQAMHEYCIHPVILDCFFQMSVIAARGSTTSTVFFPSQIGSLMVFRPLQKHMFLYLKTVKKTENSFVLCGYFVDGNGFVLVEVRHAKVTFVKQSLSQQNNTFFQNKWVNVPKQEVNTTPKDDNILVFADSSGIGQQFSKYSNCELKHVMFNNWEIDSSFMEKNNVKYKEILFMWGIHRPNKEFPDNLSQYLAKCCETYRQVILRARQLYSGACVRTVTFRTADTTVDHINPGFALIGMTRGCITEMPDMTFQLIDISSSNPEDVEALAHVIHNLEPKHYPEVWINNGEIYTGEIIRTELDVVGQTKHTVQLKASDMFTLYTDDPYRMANVSAEIATPKDKNIIQKTVEVQIDQICSHTEDFFPVTASSWKYGNSVYWSELSTEKHNLLALDFTGTVTAVGKYVKKLKVGDQIATCYPTLVSSRVNLPESVCFSIQKVPVLKRFPCISHFILAWEVLHRQLPVAKNKSKLLIISSEMKSILSKILAYTAKRRGWEPIVSPDIDLNTKQCSAMIILPSFENILEMDTTQLPLLKNLVIISDPKSLENFQALSEHCKEDVHIHILNHITVFQKAYLKEFAKKIFKWLRSAHIEMPESYSMLSYASTASLSIAETSYFKVRSLPFIKLDTASVSSIPLFVHEQSLFKHNAIYIVTGGLTGLGFETVKFIMQNGGGHVVILSRRNPTPEMQEEIRKAKAGQDNVKIMSVSCDITNYSEVTKAMHTIQRSYPNIPIKGVFHSAVVLHDGILENLNMSLFEKVLIAKVDGAVNLHRLTRKEKLDYFVCYSSVSSFIGNAGQANYAAANSFLDTFCQYRRNMGLSGQAINWGALNLGLLSKGENIQKLLQAKGILLMDAEEVHKHLKKCLQLNHTQQAIVKFDFENLHTNILSHIPTLGKRLHKLVPPKDVEHVNVYSKPPDMRPEDYIMSLVNDLTNISLSDFTGHTSLIDLGIDSMLGMTLQSRIVQEKGISIPVLKLIDPSTTVTDIVSILGGNSSDEEDLSQPEVEGEML
uniref:Carrier domain-containing protein n=1 Tax=Leptobrachium leishanense TaxID=445787 RepID=A0A8C5Q385_9ANUR